jgi:DNA-directed RNA polymerase specialized sigma24 family protein
VLVLRFYEDMSYRDIAALLGWSAATVRSRARRGLNDLRREVTR